VRDHHCRAGTRTARRVPRTAIAAAPSKTAGAAASRSMSAYRTLWARSWDVRYIAPGTPGDAAFIQFAQALPLVAIIDRDPGNQDQHHRRDQRVGCHDERGIRTERHRLHAAC